METSDGEIISIKDTFYPENVWYYFNCIKKGDVFVIDRAIMK